MIFIIVHGIKLWYLNIAWDVSVSPSVLDEMSRGEESKLKHAVKLLNTYKNPAFIIYCYF